MLCNARGTQHMLCDGGGGNSFIGAQNVVP